MRSHGVTCQWHLTQVNVPHLNPSRADYIVSQKTVKIVLSERCQMKFQPTLKILGTDMAKTIELCKLYSFSTSRDLRQRTTV